MQSPLFASVIALVLWSFVMWAWLYATRIPAVLKYKVVMTPHQPAAEFHAQLPPEVRWKADNYNNLMEQPTLFYAVAITLAVIGAVVGEFIGSDKGLGYVILSATSYWKTELAFASMILLSFIAIMLFGAVCLVERLVCPWLAPAAEE